MPIVEITFSMPLARRRADVGDIAGVVVDADDLQHHVGVDAVGAEAERQDDVVDVADRRRAQHDRAAPPQVLLARLDVEMLQGLVDGRCRQMGVEVAALAVVDGAVGEHEQLGARQHRLRRLLLEALDRPGRGLGFEQGEVDRRGAVAKLLPQVLHEPGLVGAGDLAIGRVRERRHPVVAAEDDRERGLDRAGIGCGIVQRGPAAEDRAGREVLHLALAVDRRVGDDGDGLLEVVGKVLALGAERRQRPVVAERADRLLAVGRHLLADLDVVALPAEAGEDRLGDDHRLGRAGRGVAGDVRALERPAGLRGRGHMGRRRRPRCGPATCERPRAASRHGSTGASDARRRRSSRRPSRPAPAAGARKPARAR